MGFNIAHSEFPEQTGGLMICGYEWGYSKADQAADAAGRYPDIDWDVECTFANKELRYGPHAKNWTYDNTIKKWFSMWGFELQSDPPGAFEKSIIQTNWCDSEKHSMENDYSQLILPDQIDNFIKHIEHFRPKIIIFMGSQLIYKLQHPEVLERFQTTMGEIVKPLEIKQKPFDGVRFKLGFQSFENCTVIGLPHASGSRGLSDEYLGFFKDDIAPIFDEYRIPLMAPSLA